MRKIDLAIIGTQKSGTSSLHKYLASHPNFVTHDELEFPYFVSNEEYERGYSAAIKKYLPDYQETRGIIIKSVGIVYDTTAIQRLKEHNPEVKIVITLRNPVDRAYSAFWYAKRFGWEDAETFEDGIRPDRKYNHWIAERFCDYLVRSEYVTHIKNIYQNFRSEQVYILLDDDLKTDPSSACNSIMQYFGYTPEIILGEAKMFNKSALPKITALNQLLTDRNPIKKYIKRILPQQIRKRFKRTVRKWNEKEFTPPKMNPETRRNLVEHFTPYNNELSTIINRDLVFWNR